jgi:hypothetical protein
MSFGGEVDKVVGDHTTSNRHVTTTDHPARSPLGLPPRQASRAEHLVEGDRQTGPALHEATLCPSLSGLQRNNRPQIDRTTLAPRVHAGSLADAEQPTHLNAVVRSSADHRWGCRRARATP